MRNLRHYIKSPWRPSLIIIVGSIVGIVFIALLRKDPNLASALVAFGTLLLAIVTAMVIDNSRQQEKRRKKEGLLNEIIEWADNIARSAINRQKTTQAQFWKTKLEYKFWMAKNEYITAITTISFKDLLPCVENINKELGKAINATEEAIKMKKTTNNLKCSEEKLTEAVKELFKKAAKIKTTDIEQKEGNISKEDEATGSNEPTLKDIEEHLKRQDQDKEKEKRISNGRMLIASSLPVLGVGLGLFLYGILNVDNYLKNYHAFGSLEFYMLIIGALIAGFGFWVKSKAN